ncbi:MAG: hypothetical protein EXS01_02010 [Phycisphaerales bacterium]|nr:hypothetical protein [Phycisphaerales bacterium]
MVCPIIGLILLAIVAWLAVSGLQIRALSRAPKVACGRCGHFLAAGQLRCPECGTIWDVAWLARLDTARTRSATIRLTLAAILMLLIVVGLVLAILPLISDVKSSP